MVLLLHVAVQNDARTNAATLDMKVGAPVPSQHPTPVEGCELSL